MRNSDGSPRVDESWHVWRHCWPYGWAHVVKVESKEPEYLALLTRRLYLQANVQEKYGDKEYRKRLEEANEEEQEKEQKKTQELFDAVQDENAWLLKAAMENFASGKVAPTNPTKDSIISYPGQENRSRIVRPLEDEEGGLIIPGKY
jgi:hypothetical protein